MENFDDIVGVTLKEITKANATYVPAEDDSEAIEVEGISLVFDYGILVVENPFMIINSENERMEIAGLIGDSVRAAYSSEFEIRLIFESDAVRSISMKNEDFIGPEEASWNPNEGPIVVFN